MTQHTSSNRGRPWIARAAQAERVHDGPASELHLLAEASLTGGALTVNRALLDPGSAGAPPHSHAATTETIFLIGGSLDVLVDQEVHALSAGDLIVIPAGAVHAFAPTAGASADMLAIFTPGHDRFDYYRLLERLHRGTATVDELTATSATYDNHYAASEVWTAHTEA